jgi:hypothetical protein
MVASNGLSHDGHPPRTHRSLDEPFDVNRAVSDLEARPQADCPAGNRHGWPARWASTRVACLSATCHRPPDIGSSGVETTYSMSVCGFVCAYLQLGRRAAPWMFSVDVTDHGFVF